MSSWEYVILGGGNAAGYACRELVKQLGDGLKGKVLVITGEPSCPYERPALTKAYLHPPHAKVRARLPGFHTCVGGGGDRQTPEWYEERGIKVRTSTRVTKVETNKKALTIKATGEVLKYGKLFFCTGSSAVKSMDVGIPDEPQFGVHYIREESDAAALVKNLEGLTAKDSANKRVVLVGAGYIGLEVAAAIAGWNLEAVVVAPEEFVLSKILPKESSQAIQKFYEERGVKFMMRTIVSSFQKTKDDTLTGVVLKDGKTGDLGVLTCDLAVLGTGAQPNTGLLAGQVKEAPGIGGIWVDSNMRTSNPDIFAFGDVAAFPHEKELRRLEHVSHARESAAHAVRAALGANPGPYKCFPYFYSRVFEYTEKPFAFHVYGDSRGQYAGFTTPGGASGIVWVDRGCVSAVLVMGSPPPSPEDMDLARTAATERAEAKSAEDAAQFLGVRRTTGKL